MRGTFDFGLRALDSQLKTYTQTWMFSTPQSKNTCRSQELGASDSNKGRYIGGGSAYIIYVHIPVFMYTHYAHIHIS